MLTAADLVHLPCTPDLIDSAIAFASRSLALNRVGKVGLTLPQMRRSIASVALELAFRRYLQSNSIRFSVLGSTPFTDPDRYDISLDGRRCELITYLISHRKQVDWLLREPEKLLQAQALIPSDEFAAEYHRADDLYLFAFLLGLEGPAGEGLTSAAHPPYWMHLLPREWSRPAHWQPFKPLTLENDSTTSLSVELGGQHQLLTQRVDLPPQGSVVMDAPFYTIAYVHALEHPRGRVGLHSPALASPYVILASGWANLWMGAQDMVLAGWLSHEAFRRRAGLLSIGSATLQFDRTRVKNRAVLLTRLEPISRLIKPDLAGH
jgi:hypothetical protein